MYRHIFRVLAKQPGVLCQLSLGASLLSAACAVDDSAEPLAADPTDDAGQADFESPSEFEVASFAEDRGLELAEATERLRWQSRVPELGLRIAAELGTAFGGIWIDVNDGDRIKVGIVTSSPADRGLRLGAPSWATYLDQQEFDRPMSAEAPADARAGRTSPGLTGSPAAIREAIDVIADELNLAQATDVIEVEHTLAELEAMNEWIGHEIEASTSDGLVAGIRTDINVVQLQVPRNRALSSEQQALVDKAKTVLGPGLALSAYDGKAEPRACTYPYCDPALRGGIRIHNSGAGCTGAFVARSKVDSKMYMFTAGHCVKSPYTDNWSTKFTDGSWHVIGSRHNSIFGNGGDMAILRINNVPGWSPDNWVHVTSGPDTTTNQTYTITSERYSVIGMRICTTGAFYGASDCGVVTSLGVTVSYGGKTVKGLGRGTFCGTSGDSGAPMYASHRAYGLQVAGFSECDSLYQGISAAESKMNVNVIH